MNIQCIREKKRSSFLTLIHRGIKTLYSLLAVIALPLALFLRWMGVRVVDVKFEALGHLAVEPDLFLREQAQLNQKVFPILFAPYRSLIKEGAFSSLVSNRFLLKCWKRHFLVLDNLFLYILLHPILKSPLLQYSPYHYLAPKVSPEYKKGRDYVSIYKNSEAGSQKFTPLVTLTVEEEKQGATILPRLGVPKNSWFVCFSCREPGYYTEENLKKASSRNASIENMHLAIDEIVKRGGWCIRVGSPLAASLPASLTQYPQVIDYSKSSERSDFLDVYLAAKCRFAIGNLSGLTELPRIFGTPCVITNVVPFGTLSPSAQSLHIFKLLRAGKEGEIIPFAQCLNSYLASSNADEDYREFKVELVENTPEEIRDVTIEMLQRLDQNLSYSNEDEELQTKFRSLMNSFNPTYGAPSRVGRDFLRKYKKFL